MECVQRVMHCSQQKVCSSKDGWDEQAGVVAVLNPEKVQRSANKGR